MKKFLSLFVALAMVLSLFAGVGAHSAKAATTYTLGATTPDTSAWDTTIYHVGSSSVKLAKVASTVASSTYVSFPLDGTIKLADLVTFGASFWYYASQSTSGPQLELDFTAPTGTGHVEVTVMPLQSGAAVTTWTLCSVVSSSTRVVFYGNTTGGGPLNWDGTSTYTLAEARTQINILDTGDSVPADTWKLTGARVELWEAGTRSVYIDDITIAGTTYALESGVAHTLSSLAIAPATVTLAGGATQAFVATATYSDASTAIVTATYTATLGTFSGSTYTAPAALLANQTATITGTYDEGGVTKTATATVTISGTDAGSRISGLHSASTETLLPTYTFVDDATVTGYYYSPTATVHTVTATVTDGAPVDVFQMGLSTYMFTFPLSDPILAEGIKTITITDDATVTSRNIYVRYKVVVFTTPAPALNQASFIGGTVRNANGVPAYFATGTGVLVLVNGLPGTSAAHQDVIVTTTGAFAFSYNFPTRGDYRLVLSDDLLRPTYQLWALGGNITATTVLDPNPLYGISSSTQESYLYLAYEDGSPVTSVDSFTLEIGSVNTSFATVTPYGNGFYKLSGTTTATGNNYYKITVGGLTISYTLYFKPLDSVWNPTVKIGDLNNYHPGGTITFIVGYGMASQYTDHDHYTTYGGPGKAIGGTSPKQFVIQKGGQISLTLDANLWYTSTDDEQTAKPVDVHQKFTLNPVVLGDDVAISVTKVNKGDTKDITVTVKQANGVERNNGRVTLIADVAGMFTVPATAVYQPLPIVGGQKIVLDAIGNPNLNIVGGQYVFSGVTFNHAGHIEVLVEGTNVGMGTSWTTADYPVIHATGYDSIFAEPYYYVGITVSPLVHVLTADVNTFTAGVTYPVVKVTGAVSGLINWKLADARGYSNGGDSGIPSMSVKDNLDGSYTLNLSAVGYSYGSLTAFAYDTTGNEKYAVTSKVQWPTFTFTSVHKDGLLTDSFAEDVSLQITDPVLGNAIIPSSSEFVPQTLGSSDVLANGDSYLDVMFGDTGVATSKILSASVSTYDITTNTIKFAGLQATRGNKYVDYTTNTPTLYLHVVANGVDLYLFDALKVTAPSITLDKPANSTLIQGKVNAIAVTAKDAHGQPLGRAAVALAGNSSAYFTGAIISTSYGNGGITLPDGTVSWNTLKTEIGYVGTYRLILGVPVYADPPTNSIISYYNVVFRKDVTSVAAAADTTAPVITVADGIDGSTVASDVLVVKGTVADDTDTISYIYINGTQVNVVGGAFMYTVKLVAGENVITLQAADSVPNLATKTIKVTLKAAAAKTVIILTIGTDIVTVDGRATSVDAAPEIVNSRTFVPIRFIAETFGATVEWLPETQGITITLGDTTIGLQIGNATAVISGNIVSLESAPYIKNGRTMVPLRVISESFGGDVAWDPGTRTITISYMLP